MEKVSKENIVEAPVTIVDVDDGDNYDDAAEDEDVFVDEEEDFIVERVCRCEGGLPPWQGHC